MTKADWAYKKIRRMIIEGRFAPEKKLSLRRLARILNISIVPVSEAARKLEQEGFLITKPQSGTRIFQPTPAQKHDMDILRLAIESQAARMVAEKTTSGELEQIKKLVNKLLKFLKERKQPEAAFIDFEVHQKIVSLAKCELLIHKYDQVAALCMINFGK